MADDIKITKLVTHAAPHFDEYVALFLFQEFGEEKYPGAQTAEIVLWDGRDTIPGGPDTILLGIGGGEFDEHPTATGQIRKEGECCATLVAKKLGVHDNPALEKLLRYTVNCDTGSSNDPFGLAYMIKLMHRLHPKGSKMIMKWALEGIRAKYLEQRAFFDGAFKDFLAAETEKVAAHNGRELTMVHGNSDERSFNAFCRSEHGANADIVVQRRSSGHTSIFTKKQGNKPIVDIREVVKIIRLMEQSARKNVKTDNWHDVMMPGSVPGAEMWHYMPEGQMLLNGSESAPGKEPTKLTLAEIVDAVKVGVDPKAFEPTREHICLTGKCSATGGNRCPLYVFGLLRCTSLRAKAKAAAGKPSGKTAAAVTA